VPRLARCATFLGVLGLGVIATTGLARRLWPRSVVQPPLTEADRVSMALQALQNQRRAEQQIEVTFSDRPPGTEPGAGTGRARRAGSR
jgi:hypothetical protein